MSKFEYYEMCDCLSIFEAALLIIDEDPKDIKKLLEDPSLVKDQESYTAVLKVLKDSITYSTLSTRKIVSHKDTGIDWKNTIIWRKELRDWLLERKRYPKFFFSKASGPLGCLDPKHPRYAPKLAAAVKAWLAMEDKAATKGKNPKKALDAWLRKNASELGLIKSDGTFNNGGIEECAKVANWRPGGGATRTPS